MQTDYKNQISFNARIGKNLKMYLCKNEFGGSSVKTEKFEKLFHDTFERNIDTNTVLEMNSRGKFYLYNLGLKGVKNPIHIFEKDGKTLAQRVLHECSTAYSRAEYVLFQKYISTHVLKGQSLDKIEAVGKARLDGVREPYFNDLVRTASRILKEKPKSKLTDSDFSNMTNIQLLEEIESPEFQAKLANFGLSYD